MDSLRESGLLGNQVMYSNGFPAGIGNIGKPDYNIKATFFGINEFLS
jgi:hypothetical protein